MKRKTKILLTVLSVLLIAGALMAMMLVSAADVKGVTIKSTQSFQTIDSGWKYTASDGTNPKVGNVNFLISGRAGAVAAASSMPYDSNKYVVITQTDKVGSSGPYVYASAGAYPDIALLNNSTYDMSKYSFFTFDIDVMAPSGKFIEMGIDVSTRYKNASGGNAIWSNTALSNIVKFGNDTNGSYIYLNGNTSNKKYIDPYEFTHITLIVEPKISGSSYNANTYVYVNGEYFSYKAGTTNTAASAYYQGIAHVSVLEYRLNFGASNYPDRTFAFDNPTFRLYDKTYDGNLASVISDRASLDTWESNLYDASNMPVGTFAAYNDTTRVIYDTISEAINAANVGDLIHIARDSEEPIVLTKEISISTANGFGNYFNVNITAGEGYTLVPTLDGIYKCEKEIDKLYEYVSGGVTKTADRSMTIAEVIKAADSGSTVKLFDSVYADADSSIGLSKNLTLDLGGNVLICKQANKTSFLSLNSNYSFTLKNGTFVAEYDAAGKKNIGYPAFSLSNKSKLTLTDVDTYTACIVWSYSGNNTAVTINGGSHYQQSRAADVSGGFFESRANTTFVANDATFYCGTGVQGLFSSLHYKLSSTATKKSTFTYNNCKIYSATSAQGLIPWSNEFTEVYFYGCDIVGSIHPALHDWEITQVSVPHGPAKAGSIVIGEGCRVAKGASFSSAVRVDNGFSLAEKYTSVTVDLDLKSGSLAGSDFSTVESSLTVPFAYEVAKVDSHKVVWYGVDGKTVIKTETVTPGAAVTPPSYESVQSNGWFTACYDGWAETLGGVKTDNFTIIRDTAFYPAISGELVADLTLAGYNLSLIGSISVNLYLPVAPSSISIDGVYGKGGKEVFADKVLLGGEQYLRYTLGDVGATSLTDSVSVKVLLTVNGQQLEKSFELSPYNYSGYVLADSNKSHKAYSDSAYALVADMLRYSNNLTRYVNYVQSGTASDNALIAALLDEYRSFCTPLPTDFSDTSEVDVSGLLGYLSGITYEVSGYQPSYKLTFAKDSRIVDCYVKMNGYYSDYVNGANYGEITYKSDRHSYFSGTEYISSAYISNIPMYNLDNTIEIVVLLESGMIKSGTFNLNGYYNEVSVSDENMLSHLRTFVKSLRAFSASAEGYRYDTVVITDKDAIDFRRCEHPEAETVTLALGEGILPLTVVARYCDACKNYLVYYSDYGAVGDGSSNGLNADGSTNMSGKVTVSGTNDFASIREAHAAANAIAEKFPEKNVVVVGKGLVGNNFYMGYPDDGGTQAIKIKTDVNWDGAHFIIDDTTVHNKDETREAYRQAIFSVVGDESMRGVSVTANIPGGVAQGATNIGYAPGRPLMIKLVLKSVRHYIRYGGNVNSGSEQNEMIIVDAYGNIDPTTPVQWDYTNRDYCSTNVDKSVSNSWVVTACTPVDKNTYKQNSETKEWELSAQTPDGKCDTCKSTITKAFSATAYAIDDEPITINGLNAEGEINCIWETITNDQVDISGYDQAQRNISTARSNVTYQGFNRVFVEDNDNTTPRQTYAAFINVTNSYNIVLRDMLVDYHLAHNDAKGILLGSYEFGGGNSINISWINCIQKDFFRYSTSDKNYIRYGGMFGTNFLRNVYINGCVMSSFDAHSGLYNATIENSTFDHVNFVGGGDAIMRNVVVYAEANAGACQLRSDYGSMWQGNIMFDGVVLRHDADYSGAVELIKAFYTNHYFGFDTELPEKIYINNVSIKQYNRTSEAFTYTNGIVYEDEVTSSKPLYLYNNINSQMKNDYDYSTINANNKDPKSCTKNVYITNTDVQIIYPNHWFYEDMKVYVDGVEQNWFKLREGLHSHTVDGTGKCTVCGKQR